MTINDVNTPEYIIFAGVNGAGKSTFYHTFAWTDSKHPQKIPRVNPDEFLVTAQGKWTPVKDQAKAAKAAVRAVHKLMEQRLSFNQETTLSGHSALKRIVEASSRGYLVRMFYIGIDSPIRALKRISHRKEIGGHGIDGEVVVRRYRESLSNLSKAVRICDEVIIFDNTTDFTEIARWSGGVLSWVGRLGQRGQWLVDAMRDEEVWSAS